MNYKLLFNTAILAGEIMMKNGAETHRAEDTINHILKMSGFKVAESFVTATGIFVTLADDSIDTITSVRRVKTRNINLNKISLVNDVSRNFCDSKIDLEQAYNRLLNIDTMPSYSKRSIFLANSVTPLFFAMVFANYIAIREIFISLICGISLATIQHLFKKYNIINFFSDFTCSVAVAIIASLFAKFYILNTDLIIISSIMPLVPGVAITNAIRDTLYGDYLSGLARAAEAFIIAVSIALGVGCGLAIFKIGV